MNSATIEEYKRCILIDLSICCRAGFVVFIVMVMFTYQMEETVWIATDAIIVSIASMVMGTWNVSPVRYSVFIIATRINLSNHNYYRLKEG